jgi:hypothetical protein
VGHLLSNSWAVRFGASLCYVDYFPPTLPLASHQVCCVARSPALVCLSTSPPPVMACRSSQHLWLKRIDTEVEMPSTTSTWQSSPFQA